MLNPTQWQQFRLMEKEKLSDNTALYRFKLSRANNILGLPIGQHISVKATIDGKEVQRFLHAHLVGRRPRILRPRGQVVREG